MAVEEAQLLPPVLGITGRVQVDHDALRPSVQTPSMPLDDAVGQRLHPVKLFAVGLILELRQRRLRGQVRALDRMASHQHFCTGSSAAHAASFASG